jgi:hypothetical protein
VGGGVSGAVSLTPKKVVLRKLRRREESRQGGKVDEGSGYFCTAQELGELGRVGRYRLVGRVEGGGNWRLAPDGKADLGRFGRLLVRLVGASVGR